LGGYFCSSDGGTQAGPAATDKENVVSKHRHDLDSRPRRHTRLAPVIPTLLWTQPTVPGAQANSKKKSVARILWKSYGVEPTTSNAGRTRTSSSTASAERLRAACSSVVNSTSITFSTPPAPRRIGTP